VSRARCSCTSLGADDEWPRQPRVRARSLDVGFATSRNSASALGQILTFGRPKRRRWLRPESRRSRQWLVSQHRTEVPDADVQATATPTGVGRGQRQLVMTTNRRNRPMPPARGSHDLRFRHHCQRRRRFAPDRAAGVATQGFPSLMCPSAASEVPAQRRR
jgi:hypothetical protein